MLKVENLHATVGDKEILKGINLEVKAGEVHAIMGPNGSGKSTLASVLAGNEKFTVTEGKVEFEGETFWAPVGYDAFLSSLYGNYMPEPPPEKRKTHHVFKAYKL